MCVFGYLYAHVCAHVDAKGPCQVSILIGLHLTFWGSLSLNLELMDQLEWLASDLQGLLASNSRGSEEVLMHEPLSHLPSPFHLFCYFFKEWIPAIKWKGNKSMEVIWLKLMFEFSISSGLIAELRLKFMDTILLFRRRVDSYLVSGRRPCKVSDSWLVCIDTIIYFHCDYFKNIFFLIVYEGAVCVHEYSACRDLRGSQIPWSWGQVVVILPSSAWNQTQAVCKSSICS